MGRDDPQLKLRLTDDMKAKITEAAKANGRSVNAEIVARLEASEGGGGAAAEEWRKRFEQEHAAYLRMERLYEDMRAITAEYRQLLSQANVQAVRHLGTIESLGAMLLELDEAPSSEVREFAQRMREIAAKAISEYAHKPTTDVIWEDRKP